MTTTPYSRTIRAALYERVSSEEQVEGYSLDARTGPVDSTVRPIIGRSRTFTGTKVAVPARTI
jgi:hypothetical protein